MDGLLIDSEDMVAETLNEILEKNGRPKLNPKIHSQLMGVPGSSHSDLFHDWAKLPITRDEYGAEAYKLMYEKFTQCKPLSGAAELVSTLSRAHSVSQHVKIELAVASTSSVEHYRLKTTQPETRALLEIFSEHRRILENNPLVPRHKTKPAPDVYNIALAVINETRPAGTEAIKPDECLAFEDSIVGVEAARRAGMRVIWVPHPILKSECDQERQGKILAGRSGLFNIGNEHQLGQVDDGRGQCIDSLNEFVPGEYGIELME